MFMCLADARLMDSQSCRLSIRLPDMSSRRRLEAAYGRGLAQHASSCEENRAVLALKDVDVAVIVGSDFVRRTQAPLAEKTIASRVGHSCGGD
jgi:hypothetical protein